ncbi:MAG TPA: hypothetical protein VHF47_00310 [Acidimicrobiales bacterium]|nr:hypothetical protein [Acidimicrobiales bacterium]
MRRSQEGQVAGLEGLLFGVLLFVFGTLLLVNAWAVVDAKLAASAAAREATRSFVEAGSTDRARAEAEAAGRRAFAGYGRTLDRADVRLLEGALARCARVTFEAAYRLPALRVPVLGGLGSGFRVAARHSEVVDPHRSGLPGEGDCAG